ncbi:ABC transporter permease [Kamptonema cortianum]|nr:ABC transporter permease [Geitlerinema splendidum]MDK3155955.1 ABC transporter permease [Kamptonema cortianum]
MIENLKELWRFRELLWAMVEREIRIRYKNSFLGFFWSLLNPLVTVAVMTVVFKFLMRNGTENFSAYILAAYLPFMFFNMALMDSAQSVLTALPVVRKVYFPREILPLASIISNIIHLLLAFVVFFLYLFAVYASTGFADSPFTYRILFLPVLLFVYISFTTGLSLFVSALNVFYEDVKYILSVTLYLLFFLTPIMYFSETVFYSLKDQAYGKLIYTIYHLNPVAMMSTAFRKALVPPGRIEVVDNGVVTHTGPMPMEWGLFGITALISVVTLIGGYALFNRMKWRFVERP